MEKIQLDIQLNDRQIKIRKKTIENLLQNKILLKFLEDNNLDNNIVEKYPYRFKMWLESLEKCRNCAGLDYCKQDIRGEYFDITYDGVLDLQIENCSYALNEFADTKHIKKFWYNDLPQKFWKVNITDALDKDHTKEYLKRFTYIYKWLKDDNIKGIFIQGDVGVGKTYLAACIANKYAKDKYNVAFVHVPTFVNNMKDLMLNDINEYQIQLSRLKNAYLTIFDDIGAEAVTSFTRDDLLFPILDYRMNYNKLTCFTSNENTDSLHQHFAIDRYNNTDTLKADRIISRISALSDLVNLTGKDRRL